MSQPLMPHATASWLVDNSALSFDQIAEFCGLHILEVQAIADDTAIAASFASGPSFDCARAASAVEKMLCLPDAPDLGQADHGPFAAAGTRVSRGLPRRRVPASGRAPVGIGGLDQVKPVIRGLELDGARHGHGNALRPRGCGAHAVHDLGQLVDAAARRRRGQARPQTPTYFGAHTALTRHCGDPAGGRWLL